MKTWNTALELANWMANPETKRNSILAHLPEITAKIAEPNFATEFNNAWNAESFSGCLYGLKGLPETAEGMWALLEEITIQLKKSNCIFDAQSIAYALFGLKNMNSENDSLQNLLKELTKKLESASENLNSESISYALCGLQGMNAQSEIEQALVAVLAKKIRESNIDLDSQKVVGAIYGLQGMSADSKAVQDLVTELANRIDNKSCKLSDLSYALFGLQSMDANSLAVQNLLNKLADKIYVSREEADAAQLSNALYGLQNMSEQSSGVKKILKSMIMHIQQSTPIWSPKNMGQALHGLRNMNADNPVVAKILSLVREGCMEILTYENHAFAWAQTCSFYLMQWERHPDNNNVTRAVVDSLFDDKKLIISSSEDLRRHFVDKLKKRHLSEGKLDLHELDYLSAQYLLSDILSSERLPQEIITGQGIHSSAKNRHAMRKLAEAELRKQQIRHQRQPGIFLLFGRIVSAPSSSMTRSETVTAAEKFRSAQEIAQWFDLNLGKMPSSPKQKPINSLVSIAEQISQSEFEIDKRNKWDSKCFARCLKALHEHRATEEIALLLKAITEQLSKSQCRFDAQDISDSLYGLQCMDADTVVVQNLLLQLNAKMQGLGEPLNARAIGYSLYGLQCMSAESFAVQSLVKTLTEKISASIVILDAFAIGRALFGLQRMCSDAPEVNNLIRVLSTKIEDKSCALNEDTVGRSLYGLQSMNTKSPEVLKLLKVLEIKIRDLPMSLSPNSIGYAIYGLKCIVAEHPADGLLAALTEKITSSPAQLDSIAIYNILGGLRHMDQTNQAVDGLLEALAVKIQASTARLSSKTMNAANTILVIMPARTPAAINLLMALQTRIDASVKTAKLGPLNNNDTVGPESWNASADKLWGREQERLTPAEIALSLEQHRQALSILKDEIPAKYREVGLALHLRAISKLVSTAEFKWNATQVAGCLYALRDLHETFEIYPILSALSTQLENSSDSISAKDIGLALLGLQKMNDKHKPIQELLQALANKMKASTETLQAEDISNAVYGLKRMRLADTASRELVKALTEMIKKSDSRLDFELFSKALYGMQSMPEEGCSVDLLDALQAKVNLESTANVLGISQALYGLRGLSAKRQPVQKVLTCLTDIIMRTNASWTATAIGQALNGLRSMTAESPAVQNLLNLITAKMQASNLALHANSIGQALGGLSSMNAESSAVQNLLNTISLIMQDSNLPLDADSIGHAISGLRNMDAKTGEVQQLLKTFTVKISALKIVPSGDAIGNIIIGLRSMNADTDAVKKLITNLSKMIIGSKIVFSVQSYLKAFSCLPEMNCKSDATKKLLNAFAEGILIIVEELDYSFCSQMFNALQKMPRQNPDVQRLLIFLVDKIDCLNEEQYGRMSLSDFSTALSVLRGMDWENPAIREALRKIEKKQPKTLNDQRTIDWVRIALLYLSQWSANLCRPSDSILNLLFPAYQPTILSFETMLKAFGDSLEKNANLILLNEMQLDPLSKELLHSLGSSASKQLKARIQALINREKKQCIRCVPQNPSEVVSYLEQIWQKKPSDSIIHLTEACSAAYRKDDLAESLEAISNVINTAEYEWNSEQVAACLYALRGLENTPETSSVLGALSKRLKASNDRLSFELFSKALYGMQSIPDEDCAVELLDALIAKADMSLSATGLTISQALYGLRSMSARSQPVQIILMRLTDTILRSQYNWTPNILAQAFNSLRSMTGELLVVQNLLSAIISKMRGSHPVINAYSFVYVLNGLRGMNAENPIVKNLLCDITIQIKSINAPFSAELIVSALVDLCNMKSEARAVQNLIDYLIQLIRNSKTSFSSEFFLEAFPCLIEMSSKSNIRKMLLNALTERILTLTNGLDYSFCSQILNALQNMPIQDPDVQRLFIFLGDTIESFTEEQYGRMSLSDFSTALYALKNMNWEHPAVEEVRRKIEMKRPKIINDLCTLDWARIASLYLHKCSCCWRKIRPSDSILSILFPASPTLIRSFGTILKAFKKRIKEDMSRGLVDETQLDPLSRDLLNQKTIEHDRLVASEGLYFLENIKAITNRIEATLLEPHEIATCLKLVKRILCKVSNLPPALLFLVAVNRQLEICSKEFSAGDIRDALSTVRYWGSVTFQQNGTHTLRLLNEKIQESKARLDAKLIEEILSNLLLSGGLVQNELIRVLTAKIKMLGPNPEPGIIKGLLGLQHMPLSPAVTKLLKQMTRIIEKSPGNLDSEAIQDALAGLKKMEPSERVVEEIRCALARKSAGNSISTETKAVMAQPDTLYAESSPDTAPKKFFESVAGLAEWLLELKTVAPTDRSQDETKKAFKDCLSRIAIPIDNPAFQSDLKNILSCLKTLAEFPGWLLEKINLFRPVIRMLDLCSIEFSSADICNALNIRLSMSLHHLRTDIELFYRILANKISESGAVLNAEAIADALSALEATTAEQYCAEDLLWELAEKIIASPAVLDAQTTARALNGLQSLQTDSLGAKNLLAALAEKIDKAAFTFDIESFANALYGLQCMNIKDPRVRNLLRLIDARRPSVFEIQNIFSWAKLCAFYLKQPGIFHELSAQTLDVLFPDANPPVRDFQSLSQAFLEKLKKEFVRDNLINLSRLDPTSSIYLLSDILQGQGVLAKEIRMEGSYSHTMWQAVKLLASLRFKFIPKQDTILLLEGNASATASVNASTVGLFAQRGLEEPPSEDNNSEEVYESAEFSLS